MKAGRRLYILLSVLMLASAAPKNASAFQCLGSTFSTNLTVASVTKASPAKKAKIKLGDKLLSINGIVMESINDLYDFFLLHNPGENISIKFARGKKEITKNIILAKYYDIHLLKIYEILMSGQNVNLLVMTGGHSNVLIDMYYGGNPDMKKSWQKMVSAKMIQREEEDALQGFSAIDSFSVVERSLVNNIIEEIQFSDTGYISNDTRLQIGQLTGATHILFISVNRTPYQSNRGHIDSVFRKLISIENGTVLSSVSVKSAQNSRGDIIKNAYQLDN